jgi:hypothetical protein
MEDPNWCSRGMKYGHEASSDINNTTKVYSKFHKAWYLQEKENMTK